MPNKFYEKIYAKLKEVPKGKITTYKILAKAINSKAYRAIGTALKKNPYSPIVPCHRVVRSNKNVGGFAKSSKKKIEMLKKEGIKIKNNKVQNFEKVLYKFNI